MAEFEYTAYSESGQMTRGRITATSDHDARQQLRERGLLPRALTAAAELQPQASRVTSGPRLSDKVLTLWANRIAVLLKGGLSLDKALDIAGQAARAKSDRAVDQVNSVLLQAIKGGDSAFRAARASGQFPTSAIGLLEAAEKTGDLTGAFFAIADEAAERENRRQTILNALTYPMILSAFAVFTVVFMLSVVVPRFQPIFARAGDNLPPNTARILAASDWFLAHWTWVFVGLGILVIVMMVARTTGQLGAWMKAIARRLPVVGAAIQASTEARVTLGLARFLNAGIRLPEALQLAQNTVDDAVMRRGLAKIEQQVIAGQTLSATLAGQGIFKPDTVALVGTGEESGALPAMLELAGAEATKRAATSLKRVLSMIEPVLILFIGLIVGGIIFSIFQAVLSINDVVI